MFLWVVQHMAEYCSILSTLGGAEWEISFWEFFCVNFQQRENNKEDGTAHGIFLNKLKLLKEANYKYIKNLVEKLNMIKTH